MTSDDLRTTCLEVKLKAVKTGGCCKTPTNGDAGGGGGIAPTTSKRRTFRRSPSVFHKAVLIAQTTIPLAEINLAGGEEGAEAKVQMFNLEPSKDGKAKSLSRKSHGGTLSQLVLSSQSSTEYIHGGQQ